MNDSNELLLLVCHGSIDTSSETRHSFPCRSGTRLFLSLDQDGRVVVNSLQTADLVALIDAKDGRWVVSAADGGHIPHLNRSEINEPVVLNGGDVLAWAETQSFVACHPSKDLPPVPEKKTTVDKGPGNTSMWLHTLREAGSRTAEYELFQRYYPRILDVARLTLHSSRFRTFDEDDVANEALSEFYSGLSNGKFSEMKRREDLWAMLVCITRRRAIDMLRRASAMQRCPDQMRGESVFQFNSIEDVRTDQNLGKGDDITDSDVFESKEEVEHFLSFLKAYDNTDTLCQIAHLRMEGITNASIAKQVGSSLRAVERATSQIRTLWQQHSGRSQ